MSDQHVMLTKATSIRNKSRRLGTIATALVFAAASGAISGSDEGNGDPAGVGESAARRYFLNVS